MAWSIQQRGTAHQLRVTHKLLPRAFFATFDERLQAESYRDLLLAQLERGVVPAEVLARLVEPKRANDPTVLDVLDSYATNNQSASRTDREMLSYIRPHFPGVRMSGVSFDFAVQVVSDMRVKMHLAPGTIRQRVGCLGRIWEWHYARSGEKGVSIVWRLLPAGYSIATEAEQKQFKAAGKKVKRDQKRERRFEPGEEDRIEAVLRGEKPNPELQRALCPPPDLEMLYRVILWTGLRLREGYMLKREHVDLQARLIHAQGTKGHRGAVKPRDVPIRKVLREYLEVWLAQLPAGEDRLFPGLWSGTEDKDELDGVSNRLSQRFSALFNHAQMAEFQEHDLRHEATCRWVLLKNEQGGWLFSESMLTKIMGWTSPTMIQRYMSLRGEDMVAMLGENQ